jgi:hypothetical protein
MTTPSRVSMHGNISLNEIFQHDDEVHSLGRLFVGCVAYLDQADGQSGICRFAIPLHVILML